VSGIPKREITFIAGKGLRLAKRLVSLTVSSSSNYCTQVVMLLLHMAAPDAALKCRAVNYGARKFTRVVSAHLCKTLVERVVQNDATLPPALIIIITTTSLLCLNETASWEETGAGLSGQLAGVPMTHSAHCAPACGVFTDKPITNWTDSNKSEMYSGGVHILLLLLLYS
jgi:hypothetical protein